MQMQWTSDLIEKFWDHWAATPRLQSLYFTYQVGAQIADFLSYIHRLDGARVLDYGCGPGYLVERLLDRGSAVYGVESSRLSRGRLNRFLGRPGWIDSYADISEIPRLVGFDLIVCIETIEHMDDPSLHAMLKAFRRQLSPGGSIVITTPNDEVLANNDVYCPKCDHEFHRVQHVRSWNKNTLAELLEYRGFAVQFCEAMDFTTFGRPPRKRLVNYSLSDAKNAAKEFVRSIGKSVPLGFPANVMLSHNIGVGPHLVAVAI